MGLVLISHDLGVVAETCERIAVMYAGRIVEQAPTERLFANPSHPYTRGLLGALPPLDGERQPLVAIPGNVPDPRRLPRGCAFAPRCPERIGACDLTDPSDARLGRGHRAACLRAGEALREAVP
jgi:peptide/nickel transport system ATP-binding protein